MSKISKRIARLRAEIAEHDRLYYKEAMPRIDDQAYDCLKAELAELEAQNPEFDFGNSPTQSVGDDRLEAFKSYKHRKPMLSLDNTYSKEELIEFGRRLEKRFPDQKLDYLVEPKIDGVAISLTYEKGNFIRAISRGNGTEGDDITQNVRHIRGIPKRIHPTPDVLEVRGEIYMRHKEFERINKLRATEGLALYANPRNLAAGTVKLLNPAEAGTRKLDIVLYGIGSCQPANYFTQQSQIQEQLAEWNFAVLERNWLVDNIESSWSAIEKLDALRRKFAYPTDGAVVKLNDFKLQERAGFTSKALRPLLHLRFQKSHLPSEKRPKHR